MSRKTDSAVMLFLLVISILTLAFKIQIVKAQGGTIYINPDGSISPPTAPIYTADNITYTLTGDINAINIDGIVIHKFNIVLDGAGHYLGGGIGRPGTGKGITLAWNPGVTVKNMTIGLFGTGIFVQVGSRIYLSNNIIAGNGYGIWLESYGCTVSGNTISGIGYGIYLPSDSGGNTLSGNTVTNCMYCGIRIESSQYGNTLSGNTVTGCNLGGIELQSSNNLIFHNTFANPGQPPPM